jgi:hypothetical protein
MAEATFRPEDYNSHGIYDAGCCEGVRKIEKFIAKDGKEGHALVVGVGTSGQVVKCSCSSFSDSVRTCLEKHFDQSTLNCGGTCAYGEDIVRFCRE